MKRNKINNLEHNNRNFPLSVIIGGGPAGLTAAYKLAKHGLHSVVLEKSDRVGGISRTETYKGYRFDIGGHRFFTKVPQVQHLWNEVLGDEFIKVKRLSRIYYNGKFFNYPIELFNTVSNLGVLQSFLIIFSYLKIKISPLPVEENFEQWVTNRFGERLYQTFFKSYTEKIWGISCIEIKADWAAQRIRGLCLNKAVINALFSSNSTKTLIKEFDYPILGPGMMWERFQEKLNVQGSPVLLNTEVIRVERQQKRITRIIAQKGNQIFEITGDHFINTMPITALMHRLDPLPPDNVLKACRRLKYRDFLIVPIVINQEHLFPDNWIYIHSPEFKVGRIQNFKNWSPQMVADTRKTCLGMEYFCSEGDDLWSMDNQDLIRLASEEIVNLGLLDNIQKVEDGTVIREKKAYPVYDCEYQQNLKLIQDYVDSFENLQSVGRNGMHRYNNQDHSMLSALLAAENIMGANHNLWTVNTERSYHEEFMVTHKKEPVISR
ncbi:NAD(P)/FAD-dependent oxidoreductase [Anabaena cylindrica FACHB-243]|uniref:Amine oxidase n=1 Tax=Anabaena cylindrica (strain ATCC 27899 / PCC 7122) TaxID=272123 RepID=K9ZKG7_ANACC|nr:MULTISPECIES: NAD(P)/FAD-dependent oxidoreductase [Anabaena]AFZ59062.1 amine oxidase [Anabaena cylindrica PCC 7122]MBD2420599.1 NAD(P)/FAD-dependent oxidoreductase [Anabaena cylindrica FACHB-243]MBY5282350.1 NAD(P)/FAD-dependent oxidoreductase [Anabaena sp. CCAP 1446/1C]MBY5309239.1 NAD(P)/FAD-dependent oxidoreductase [Anabaena sp. CCAP 1446/1C]MCM2408557.1 NAD(P)/FAD-dependent oxidoreductase [Anabaena sp. CCAP 1446/1C]